MSALKQHGLGKLAEECGELIQVIGKLIQYPELQTSNTIHPDGSVLLDRLKEEISDVLAAIDYVSVKLNVDADGKILERRIDKFNKFCRWEKE